MCEKNVTVWEKDPTGDYTIEIHSGHSESDIPENCEGYGADYMYEVSIAETGETIKTVYSNELH